MKTVTCPDCGAIIACPCDDEQAAISVESLRRDCIERGWLVLPGDRVFEDIAAKILGLSPSTLKTWRSRHGQDQLPWKRSAGTGRVSYLLADLADFLNK